MLEQKIFSRYSDSSTETLSSLSSALYETQQKRWQMLADGVAALESVRSRIIDCGTMAVRVQFNPKRIVSTGAKVDAASIKERKCFLCVPHLPDEQQGVLYREKFLVLCNPMPIFRQHFTVSHIDHIPQSIEEHIITFLDLAKDFSASHTVFYNGPKCGASAPDHMHFQASPKDVIPVENEAILGERRHFHKKVGEVSVLSLAHAGRAVIILECAKKQDMEFVFLRLTGAMRKVMNTNDEPMMNVLCSFTNGLWRMIIFPRAKHRPDAYFKEGDEKILISPAAVDIGGLIIAPIEKDFKRMDDVTVREIFNEVSVSSVMLEQIISSI